MTKTVRLGSRLRYPITVVKLLKSPGDRIKKTEPLLEYSFKWMREVGDKIRGDTWLEEQTTLVTWDSPVDGEVARWLLREGERVTSDRPVIEVREDCSHDIQFQGLCAMCGQDMTRVTWAAETRDTARAPISMVHDHTNLTVSATQAQRTEQELQRRLLRSRKLSLVVDLDQTIIQACIDPTVGEWQRDPTNPNHDAVKDVQSFQLDDGPGDLARRCTYYIKMRPGLPGFLKRISAMYEMHVYTMGTRAYAQHVARVVDPDKKLFGTRVISRDENGNIFAKSLQRLFPVSTHMVAIIDDRSDVWPRNRPNLLKVSPYEFFKGIGDINSSFLPKRQDLLSSAANGAAAKQEEEKKKKKISVAAAVAPTAEALAAAGDDPALTKKQEEEQERQFEKQIHDRPLQALQEQLDREDEEAEKATILSDDSSESRSSSPPSQRHRVLQDDDEELVFLEQHLATLHREFYAQYDAARGSAEVNFDAIPDAGEILDDLKSTVLAGKKIVLSGVLPRGIDIYTSEIGLQILSFGARLLPKVSRHTTHLVVNAAQPGREKLLAARRRPHIKIVSQEWLAACFSRWEAVDEGPYLFTARLVGEEENPQPVVSDDDDDGGGDENEATRSPSGKRPVLKLIGANGQVAELPADEEDPSEGEGEDDDDDDDDDDIDPGVLPDGSFSIESLKNLNWESVDQELAEFLADVSSDSEEDDGDDDDGDDDDDDEDEDDARDAGDGEEPSESETARRRSRSKTPSLAAAAQAPLKRKRNGGPSRGEGDDDNTDESDRDDVAAADGKDAPDRGGNNEDDDDEDDRAEGTPAKRLRRTTSQRGPSSLRSQYLAGAEEPDKGGGTNGLPTPGGSDQTEGQPSGKDEEMADEQEDVGDAAEEDEDEDEEFDLAELEAEFEAELDKDFAAASAAAAGEEGKARVVGEEVAEKG
ncbi:hypothetical protein VTJ83DRAFT_2909 [Remersonia thermophila]|uniref:RNA polymerase II subunit A C-terminal domain phosphatase n=1 Tax=Remersonia thermophila TaxID=72144 RepID=A0ABR4DCJ3_9PEZI